MNLHPLMLAIIASAGLGAVIGLIRQWSEQTDAAKTGAYSGVRTFTFWSVLGCVAAFLSEEYSPGVLPVILAAVGAHFIVPSLRPRTGAPSGPVGSTTFAATLLTVCVGALVTWQRREEAVLVSAIAVVLLGLKQPIHAWTRAFTDVDIRATLQFVAITGVILPLVPNEAFGPYDGFNPFSTWMMVVLISGVGFAGYVAMRLLDARSGIMLTSLLGGIASSTATTLAFSRRSRDDEKQSESYAMAVAIACTVMLPRLVILVAVINRPLAQELLLPTALTMAPGLVYIGWIWLRQRRAKQTKAAHPLLKNPLNLSTALTFAAIYALVSFLMKAAQHWDHLKDGLLTLAFLSGLHNVDAISLSVAGNLGGNGFPAGLAAEAIVLAAIANSVTKATIAGVCGSAKLRWHVIGLMIATIVAGLAGLFMLEGSLSETSASPKPVS